MDNKTITVGDAGSLLIGAGLTKLDEVNTALILIGVGVAIKILVAYMNYRGIIIQGNNGNG